MAKKARVVAKTLPSPPFTGYSMTSIAELPVALPNADGQPHLILFQDLNRKEIPNHKNFLDRGQMAVIQGNTPDVNYGLTCNYPEL